MAGARAAWAVALLTLAVASAAAAGERALSPDRFLDIVAGRTVSFLLAPGGALVGVERFIGRDRSVWTRADGTCALGEIRARGDKLCFAYDDAPATEHCWLPFKEDGATFVRSIRTGEVQRIGGISERLLGCGGEPLS